MTSERKWTVDRPKTWYVEVDGVKTTYYVWQEALNAFVDAPGKATLHSGSTALCRGNGLLLDCK